MRKAWRAIALFVALILDTFEIGDALTMLGLILLAVGLWQLSHAAALIVTGAITVWYALPTRPPFIAPRPPIRQRRDG